MTATETTEAVEVRELSYVAAFTETMRQIMQQDPDVFVAGEDVGAAGGVFGSFTGLQDEFGEMRSVDTHTCPALRNALRAANRAALSMLAPGSTTRGSLPPNSRITRLRPALALLRI